MCPYLLCLEPPLVSVMSVAHGNVEWEGRRTCDNTAKRATHFNTACHKPRSVGNTARLGPESTPSETSDLKPTKISQHTRRPKSRTETVSAAVERPVVTLNSEALAIRALVLVLLPLLFEGL